MPNVSWIGQTLNNRYRIEQVLGQGGMSAVYKANDPNLRRVVAIKMIHSHLTDNPEFVRRFEEEAAAVAQLRHENIVQVFDFNHDGDTYYMVLEFLPGETLQARLQRLNEKNRRMDMPEAVNYMAQVCEAVHYAHNRGLIHRDIKPANIMLDIYGKAILMDFGIARIVGGQLHTATGAVIGTAMYMSPEQIKGEKIDERADIYSLGITLFEAVSGKPPFEADSAMTLMMMHINDPVPDIRQLRPQVPENLIAVIEKALQKKREKRYQSAAEMEAALRAVYAELTSPVPTQPPVEKTVLEPPVEQTLVEPPVPDITPNTTRPGAAGPRPYSVSQAQPANEAWRSQTTPSVQAGPPTPPSTGAAISTAAGAGAGSAPGAGPGIGQSTKAGVGPGAKGHESSSIPRLPVILGGCAALAVIGVVGLFLIGRTVLGLTFAQTPTPAPQTSVAVQSTSNQPVLAATLPAATATLKIATATDAPATIIQPVATATTAPALPTNPPAPVIMPTPTVPTDRHYVRINKITIENGRYTVDYETFGYTEQLPGEHVHFFYNTIKPEQAGVPGKGPWVLYGGPRPFRGYPVDGRPAAATAMCALVANANHSVQPESGNCSPLP